MSLIITESKGIMLRITEPFAVISEYLLWICSVTPLTLYFYLLLLICDL